MQVILKVLANHANLRQIVLPAVAVIGRATDCQLKIASPLVSRRHCRVTVNRDCAWIEDLGSANGTFVNGCRLPPGEPCPLPIGAKLTIGQADFVVEARRVDSRLGAFGWGRLASAFQPSVEDADEPGPSFGGQTPEEGSSENSNHDDPAHLLRSQIQNFPALATC